MGDEENAGLYSQHETDSKNIFNPVEAGNMSFDSLSDDEKTKLVEKFGDPIKIPNVKFATDDGTLAGTCPDNEKAMAAMSTDQAIWPRYGVILVNQAILAFMLDSKPRIIPLRMVVGENGGILLPGYIYTESTMALPGREVLYNTAGDQGLVIKRGKRDLAHMAHLGEKQHRFTLSPMRHISEEKIFIRGKGDINFDIQTLRDIATDVSIAAMEQEAYLYAELTNELSEMSKTETGVLTLSESILRDSEQSLEDRAGLMSEKTRSFVLRPGQKVKAVIDPIYYNIHGEIAYIFEHEGKHYHIPAKNVQSFELTV